MKCENDGILVPAAVHDGQLAILVQAFEAGHASAESEMIVDRAHVLARDADIRPMMIIRVVAIGNQRIEPVVATGKLKHHQ